VRYQEGSTQQHPGMDATITEYRELAAEIGWSEMKSLVKLSKALHAP